MIKKLLIIVFLLIAISVGCIMSFFLIMDDPEPDKTFSLPYVEQPLQKKPDSIHTLEESIDRYLTEQNINKKDISMYIHSFDNAQNYMLNIDTNFFAASIYKVPLAMIYYEYIREGRYTLKDTIQYEEYHNEGESVIANKYPVGSKINLQSLLDYMILYSDNTAAHMLYENLGGWIAFKHAIAKYGDTHVDANFYSYDNILNANYMNDVMLYLYEHRDRFGVLLKNMELSTPSSYLQKYVNDHVAQKYGYYDAATNAVGIVFNDHPYSIVIFTKLGEMGEDHIGKLHRICYDFFNDVN